MKYEYINWFHPIFCFFGLILVSSFVCIDYPAHFKIDANNGEIRTTSILSHDYRPSYRMTVIASDHGVPPLQGKAIINIQVIYQHKMLKSIENVIWFLNKWTAWRHPQHVDPTQNAYIAIIWEKLNLHSFWTSYVLLWANHPSPHRHLCCFECDMQKEPSCFYFWLQWVDKEDLVCNQMATG